MPQAHHSKRQFSQLKDEDEILEGVQNISLGLY